MKSLPAPAKGVVVAAVGFDGLTELVAAEAAEIARTYDLELRLVHVSSVTSVMLLADPLGYGFTAPSPDAVDEVFRQERARLAAVAAALQVPRGALTDVLAGEPAAAVADYARLHRANLLVVGCGATAARLPLGLSTAAALMANAPLPVLVVGPGRQLHAGKGALRILLADDLQPGSEEAARRAFELAARTGGFVRHLHVHGDFREVLRDSWRDLQESPAAEAAIRNDAERLIDALHGRGAPYRERALGAGVGVETDCRVGAVGQELHAAVASFRPDLVVFGRHKALKARPFLIGRAPFGVMLREQAAVLVVPPAAELYANLAFPAR